MPFLSIVQTITDLAGPAGRLEALMNTGAEDAPYAALVTHPHPLFGGTMHNKVVYHAMKAFTHFGLPVLRFNFRGNGLSEGVHNFGLGEIEDVHAALDYLTAKYAKPILFAGFSFGSYVGLRACCPNGRPDPRVRGLIALGLPVQAAGRNYTYDFIPHCPQPKLFVSGDHDEFCPSEVLQQVALTAKPPATCDIIPGADHFFAGIPNDPKSKLDQMQSHLRAWLAKNFCLKN